METLSKLTLNNNIVNMRHSVKQSRIQAINKLVKDIKKLRDKKGTDEQKAKNSSKAERYVELIQIMKKVNEDDVSKFALINEKSLPQITNDINEIPEIKAIARISSHRPIFEKVKAFREKYADWKETLPILFETLGDKHLNKKKKPKASVDSGQRKVKTKNTNQEKSSPKVTYVHTTSGTWLVEDMNNSEANGQPEDPVENKEKKNNVQASISNSKAKSEYEKPLKNQENVRNSSRPDNFKKTDHGNDSDPEEKDGASKNDVESPTNSSGEESDDHENEDNEPEIKHLPVEKVTKTVDPFFVTKDNKEYLSFNVISNPTSSEEKKPPFKKKFEVSFSKPKSFDKGSNSKPFRKNWEQSDVRIPVKREYPVIAKEEKALHPSWEAKRKQSNISQFQGKKIKFDD